MAIIRFLLTDTSMCQVPVSPLHGILLPYSACCAHCSLYSHTFALFTTHSARSLLTLFSLCSLLTLLTTYSAHYLFCSLLILLTTYSAHYSLCSLLTLLTTYFVHYLFCSLLILLTTCSSHSAYDWLCSHSLGLLSGFAGAYRVELQVLEDYHSLEQSLARLLPLISTPATQYTMGISTQLTQSFPAASAAL